MHRCTFFGHRDTPEWVSVPLKKEIIKLIEERNVYCFYVGNQGNYDTMVIRTLRELKNKYQNITYYIVLAYFPTDKDKNITNNYCTVFPEELANVPRRFAIDKRNNWMLQQSDYVISYVTHKIGGASKFTEKAIKKGKQVINLANNE